MVLDNEDGEDTVLPSCVHSAVIPSVWTEHVLVLRAFSLLSRLIDHWNHINLDALYIIIERLLICM